MQIATSLTMSEIAQALLPSWRLIEKNDDEAGRKALMGAWEDIYLAAHRKSSDQIDPPFALAVAMAKLEALPHG